MEEKKPRLAVQNIADDWILPFFNIRTAQLYKTHPETKDAMFIDGEEKAYPCQFMQALIHTPGNVEEPDFKPYAQKFARLFNKLCKENLFNFGMLAPMSIMEMVSYDNEHKRYCRQTEDGSWAGTFISQPTEEMIALANLPFTPELVVKQHMIFLFAFPSVRVMELAEWSVDYRKIIPVMQDLSGISEKLFCMEGELASNSNIWEVLK